LIGLLKTPLRWSGVVPAVLAILWAAATPRPDVLVAADARTFAVRGADGLLAFHHSGGDTFATREWLAADGDARDFHDRRLGQASPAMLPAVSAGSPTAAWCPTCSPRMLSRRIAGARPSS